MEANIYLHDEERGELEMAGVHGCTLHGKGSRLKVGKEGMVGYVAATRQMRYAPDVRQDPYYIACEESTLSEVAIPLDWWTAAGGRVFGFASRTRCLSSASICAGCRALCEHVAVAVHNARRFQHERHERAADEPRSARSARHPAGAAAQEFALHSAASPFPDSRFLRAPWAATGTTSFPSTMAAGAWFWPTFREKERRPRC